MHLSEAKAAVMGAAAVVGGVIGQAFGGWNAAMTTLLVFMAIDYLSGLIVAGVFKASDKTESGSLNSIACWKGLLKKGVTLLVVLVAAQLDTVLGMTIVRDAAIYAFIANECISIIENAGLMGIPIPNVVMNAIETLQNKDKPVEK